MRFDFFLYSFWFYAFTSCFDFFACRGYFVATRVCIRRNFVFHKTASITLCESQCWEKKISYLSLQISWLASHDLSRVRWSFAFITIEALIIPTQLSISLHFSTHSSWLFTRKGDPLMSFPGLARSISVLHSIPVLCAAPVELKINSNDARKLLHAEESLTDQPRLKWNLKGTKRMIKILPNWRMRRRQNPCFHIFDVRSWTFF